MRSANGIYAGAEMASANGLYRGIELAVANGIHQGATLLAANGLQAGAGFGPANGLQAGASLAGVAVPARPPGVSPWPTRGTDGVSYSWRGAQAFEKDPLPPGLDLSRNPAAGPGFAYQPRQESFAKCWAAEFSAMATVAELAIHPDAQSLLAFALPPWPGHKSFGSTALYARHPDYLDRELTMLHDMIAYRDGVMAEALAQINGIVEYFQGMAGFTAASHPRTTELCAVAMQVGALVGMLHKQRWNRPRPSQIDPSLVPPIPVPGHASYPSNHALQSHLVAYMLESVMPRRHASYPMLHALADRIALNREVLGVHYRSDSDAGARLALAVAQVATRIASARHGAVVDPGDGPLLARTMRAAWAEWHGTERSAPASWPKPNWPVNGNSGSLFEYARPTVPARTPPSNGGAAGGRRAVAVAVKRLVPRRRP